MYQALTVPPEILETTDRCELDLGCTHPPSVLVITELESFFACSKCFAQMDSINKLFDSLED